ncbi:MAG: hypothetical protein HY858_16985 [Candidatus Solibacter usitatus]|nr:hypothetical protein [Candidatus Solibacter usitatus]
MREAYDLLPVPLVLGIMIFGIVLVLAACAPTAWVDRAHKYIDKRRQNR